MTNEELDEARAKEAERLWYEDEDATEVMDVAMFALRLAREGWKPPEPVDPDVLAFREWVKSRNSPREHAEIDAGVWDKYADAICFRAGFGAGVRWARGEKA